MFRATFRAFTTSSTSNLYTQNHEYYDICIVGGGIVGTSLASALCKQPSCLPIQDLNIQYIQLRPELQKTWGLP